MKKEGNKDQFEKLFKELYPKLQMLAYRLVKDEEAAEDIASEAFTKLLNSHPEFEYSHASTYLITSVRYASTEYLRKKSLNERLKKSKKTPQEKNNDLTLYFDLNDFSQKEILDTLSLLSAIYQSIGGDELEIKKMNTLEFESALIPA